MHVKFCGKVFGRLRTEVGILVAYCLQERSTTRVVCMFELVLYHQLITIISHACTLYINNLQKNHLTLLWLALWLRFQKLFHKYLISTSISAKRCNMLCHNVHFFPALWRKTTCTFAVFFSIMWVAFCFTVYIPIRLQALPLSLSPSCVMWKKTAKKMATWLAPRISCGHFFFMSRTTE